MSATHTRRPVPQRFSRPSLERLEDREMLDAALPGNFVDRTYQGLFRRDPSVQERTLFSGVFAQANGRAVLAQRLTSSGEFAQSLVRDAHVRVLGRQPTAAGLAHFSTFLLHRGHIDDVYSALTLSREFVTQRTNGSNASFVDGLYRAILGREPDARGRSIHLAALNRGLSRATLTRSFVTSLESRQRLMGDFFQRLVGRPITTAETTLHDRALDARLGRTARSIQQLVAGLVASNEYLAVVQRGVGVDLVAPTVQLTNPTNGQTFNQQVTITGQARDVGSGVASLSASLNGGIAQNVPVTADGRFTFTTNLPLDGSADALHTVTFTARDQANNVSAPVPLTFTLDTTPPGAPTALTLVNSDSGASDGITNVTSPTIGGEADTGSLISLFQNGTLVGTTTANSPWQLTLNGIAPGTHTFTATATDAVGNVSLLSAPMVVIVDTAGPQLELNATPAVVSTQLNLTGRAQDPNGVTTVRIRLDAGTFQDLTLDGTGNFTFTTNLPLDGSADGPHTLTVVAEDIAGNQSTAVVNFQLDTIPTPSAPTNLSLTDATDSGSSNSDERTRVTSPTVEGVAEPGTTVTLFVNGTQVGQTTGGNFQFPLGPLSDGSHTITATASNAGKTSVLSAPLVILIDSTAPALSLSLDAASDTAPTGDGRTEAASVILNGQTEANLEVRIIQSGTVTQADADGRFRFSDVPLVLGENSFTARVEDAAGNVSTVTITITRDVGAQPNRAPVLDPIATINIRPGEVRQIQLQASDPDGDQVTFSIRGSNLPGLRLGANGLVTIYPATQHLGTHQAIIVASDGLAETTQTVQINVVADPVTTTRITGKVIDTANTPIAGIRVQVGTFETTTAADGTFTLETALSAFDSDVLIVRGDDFAGSVSYPFLPTKFSFLLPGGRQLPLAGVENFLRDIVLPIIDPVNAQPVTALAQTTIRPTNIPDAELFIPAGALNFTGDLIITEIPLDQPPPNLPTNFIPDVLINVFPNNISFATPAPLTLPNRGGFDPGTQMTLFGLDPDRGEFDEVGQGTVSQDGRTIVTNSGGLRRTSWHFFVINVAARPPAEHPNDNTANKHEACGCDEEEIVIKIGSETALHTGGLMEEHDLVAYQSLGNIRSHQLRYDSLRADPRPILHFAFSTVSARNTDRLVASMSYTHQGVITEIPGYDPSIHGVVPGLQGGEHLWRLPVGGVADRVEAALQADLTEQDSGLYRFRIQTGIRRGGLVLAGVDEVFEREEISVNRRASIFGAGWDLANLLELVVNEDGSVLYIDGDGGDMLFESGAQPNSFVSPAGDFSTLTRLGDGTFRRTLVDQTVYQFNSDNYLSTITDRNGNVTTYEYDGPGKLSALVDPTGLRTTFTYTGSKVSAITDPAGRVTQLLHDAAGNLIRITDPDGSSRSFTYDASHRMTSETDQLGRLEQEGYGFHGRILSARQKDGSQQFFGPVAVRTLSPAALTSNPATAPVLGATANIAQVIRVDANGNVITETLDGAGLPLTTVDAAGAQPVVERDANGLPTRITDALGRTTTLVHDARGNPIRIANQLGLEVENTATLFANETMVARARGFFVALGDLDNDGDLDAVGTHNDGNISNNTVGVYLNNGQGAFGARTDVGTGGNDPRRLFLIDVNADNNLDLVVVNRASNNLGVRLGNGNGTFGNVTVFGVGTGPNDLALGDVDGDGDLDAVTVNETSNNMTVLRNNGAGVFGNAQNFATNQDQGVVLADFTGDGRLDAATSGGGVALLVGNGDGTFAASSVISVFPAGGALSRQLASADIDSDGDQDIVATLEFADSGTGFEVLLNDGVGNFTSQGRRFVSKGAPHEDLLLRDFNQDRIIDILIAAQVADSVLFFPGNGNGTFGAFQEFEIGPEPGGLAAGDLNGDGDLDIIAGSRVAQNILRLDATQGGSFVQQKFSLTNFEPNVVATADANGDGNLDLITLLNDPLLVSSGADTITVFPGDGTGRFGAPIHTALPRPPFGRARQAGENFFVGDVNGDGVVDVVTMDREQVDIDVGLGDGRFVERANLILPVGTDGSLDLGDLDGDGDLDIVVHQSNRLSIFLNNGDGTFGTRSDVAVTTRNPLGDATVRLADITGDGNLDVLTTRNTAVVLLPGNGNGTFGAAVQLNTGAGSGVDLVAAGDLDRDGNLDIVALSTGQSRVTVLRSRGDGTFDAPVAFTGGRDPRDLDLIDINADNHLDIVMASSSGDVLTVLLGNGDATFANRQEFATNSRPLRQAFGDFDNDGDLDTVTANIEDDSLYVLRNQAVGGKGPGVKIFEYDAQFNQVVRMVNEVGHEVRYTLDARGNILTATQIVGAVGGADDLVTTYTHNASGQILTETDPLGRVKTFAYDAFGRTVAVTQATGSSVESTIRREYDTAGNITAVIDPLGNRTEYEYDANNRKVVERDALGNETRFTYDARGNEVRRTDRRGNATQFEYDSLDRLIRRIDPLSGVAITEYDANGNVVASTDANGDIWRYRFDARNRRVEITDPEGGVTRNVYDAANNLVQTTDELGRVTRFEHDAENRVVAMINPLGNRTRTIYDSAGQVVARVDELGRSTRLLYDDLGRLVQIIDAAGNSSQMEYDRVGNLVRETNALGQSTIYAYNALNQLITETDATGAVQQYTKNALGLVQVSTDPLGRTTTYTYDVLNRLVSRRDALGGTATTQYDAEGNVIATVDVLGNETRSQYNSLNLLVQRTDALGGVVTTTYDAVGRIASITDALGRTVRYTRDGFGRILEETDPTGAITRTEYDARGNVIAQTDPLGNRTRFEYDALDRKVRIIDALGGTTVREYDAATNLIAVSDRNGNRRTSVYDNLDRLIRSTDALGGVTSYAYDAIGQQISTTDTLGRTTQYAYDAVGRQTRVTDAAGQVETSAYDAAGNLVTVIDALGRTTQYGYDALNRRTSFQDPLGNTATMTYDALGNLLATTDELGRTTTFAYDALNRQTQSIDAQGGTITYQYDAVGQRVRTTDELGRITQVAYDANSRPTTVTDAAGQVTRHEYDAAGNQTAFVDARGNRTEYDFDALNQLTEITDSLGNRVLYGYDAAGNRITITDQAGNVTRTQYDALHRPVKTIDALGGEVSKSFDAASQVISITDQLGRTSRFTYDAIGRNLTITDATGAISSTTYDAVGNQLTYTDPLGRVTRTDYDALDRVIRVTDALGGITEQTFDAVGNILSTRDANGRTTTFVYDSLNRLLRSTDALGGVTQTQIDAAGQVLKLIDALGQEIAFAYDSLGRTTATTDAGGFVTSTEYDANGNVTARVDALGRRTSFIHDALNRLTRTTDALAGTIQYAYDSRSNLVSVTDQRGNVTGTEYDALNRRVKVIDALNAETRTIYDAASQIVQSIDQLGRSTTFAYDAVGRLTTVTDALGQTTTNTYDAVGNRTRTTDALGRASTLVHDALNRVIRSTDALGNSTQFGYDAVGNPTTVTDALGAVTTTAYDALNRPVTTTDALGGVRSQQFDAIGQLVSSTDPLGRQTTFQYDTRGNQTRLTDPLGNATTYAYDAVGQQIRITDALGNVTQFEYDALSRRTKVTDARLFQTQYAYDATSNLTRVTDASGNVTQLEYDGLNRLVRDTNPLGATRQISYDAAGNRTRLIDRIGRQIAFTYDAVNRLTEERWLSPDGTVVANTISVTYDAAGQTLSIGDSFARYGFSYDAAGRTTQISNAGTPGVPTVVQQFTFDVANNLTRTAETIGATAGAITDYQYDALKRVTRITQTGTGVAAKRADYAHNLASQVTTVQRFADAAGTQGIATTTYAFDAAGRSTQVRHTGPGGSPVVNQFDYVYDALNRITTLSHADGTAAFSYDAVSQVVSADYSFQSDENFSYDSTGNRTTPGVVTGADNRLNADDTFDYVHDAEGNRIRQTNRATGEVTQYSYDHRNRLTAMVVRNAGGTVIRSASYAYDAFNRRIDQTVDANGATVGGVTTTRYVYDGDQIALTFDGSGNLTRRVLSGPGIDQILAEETPTDLLWSLADLQGSVTDVLDESGNLANHLAYGTFGEIRSETQAALDHLFSYIGRELDEESGLYYHRNRYYDADSGRYLSTDPTGFAGGDVNLYRYVGNNPVNLTDPFGLRAKSFFEDLEAFQDSAPALKAKFDLIEQSRANGASADQLKNLNDRIDAGIRDGSVKADDIQRAAESQLTSGPGLDIVAARDQNNRLIFVDDKAVSPGDLKRLTNEEATRLSAKDLAEGKVSDTARRAIEDATDKLEQIQARDSSRQEFDRLGQKLDAGELFSHPERAGEIAARREKRQEENDRAIRAEQQALRDQVGAGVFQAAERNIQVRNAQRAAEAERNFREKELPALLLEGLASSIPGVGLVVQSAIIARLDPCKDEVEVQIRLTLLAVDTALQAIPLAGLVERLIQRAVVGGVGRRAGVRAVLNQVQPDNLGGIVANADDVALPGGLVVNPNVINNQIAADAAGKLVAQNADNLSVLDQTLLRAAQGDETIGNTLIRGSADELKALGLTDDQIRKIQSVQEEIRAGVNNTPVQDAVTPDFTPDELDDFLGRPQGLNPNLAGKADETFIDNNVARDLAGDQTALDSQLSRQIADDPTVEGLTAQTQVRSLDSLGGGNQTQVLPSADDLLKGFDPTLPAGSQPLAQTQRLAFPIAEIRGNTTQVLPGLANTVKPANLLDDTVENAAARVAEKLRPSNLLDASTKEAAERVRDVIQNNVKSPLVGKADDAFRDVATTFENIQERAFNRAFDAAAQSDVTFAGVGAVTQENLREVSRFLGLSFDDAKGLFGDAGEDFINFVAR